jgi:hypothetical protein
VLVVQAPLPVRRGEGSRAEGSRAEGFRAGRHLHSVPPGTGSGTDQAGSAPWPGPTRLAEEAP